MAARQQECGICMENCKNLWQISCHHSFCCKCLDDYVQVDLCKGRFDCPICRTNVELPKGGVRCFETKSCTDTNSDEKFACDVCGPKSVACSRCLDCEENLCQSCCYVHEKLKVSRHHKVRDLGTLDFAMKGKIRQRTFCDQHPEEEIKLICRDCNILICVLCKAVDHENHATKAVVDAAAEMKKTLQTKMTSCSDKLRNMSASKEKAEQLERSIDDAEREELKSVEDQRSHLNQLLGQEVAKVKATIKNVYLSLRQQNAILKRDIQDELRSCSDVFENAQKLTQQGSDIEIIKKGPALDQLISEGISKTDQMPNIRLKNKLFSPAEINQSELIALIGKMQDSTDSGKFVPRRDDNNPKTIDQIHREVAEEAQDRAIFVQTLPQAKPQKGNRGRPGQPSGPMGFGADGWNTVSRAPLRTDRTIDPTKLKLSKLGDSKNIQLGPVAGAARLGWFKGSSGGGARSQEGERPNAPGNRTIVAQRRSEERSGGRETECAKTVEKLSTPVQELTDDQMLSKTRAIMDEYLHIQDVKEAVSCVQELSSSGSLHLFVSNALNQVLERSEVARRQTGLLLHDLVKNNVLMVDTYVKGLNEILMFAEDMEIDIPKIWEYLGQLIGPMLQDGSVPLGFLKQVCEPLRANGKSGILVAEILHDASHREGHKKVGKLWVESGLHWSDFVLENQIDQFLYEKKLDFTRVGNSAPTSRTASMDISKIEERLNDLITNKGCSNEEVIDWIEEEVDKLTIKQEYFIRALMTAVCKSAVKVSSNNLMKVDKSQVQRRNNLLQNYLDHQANFELQALFALQVLIHKLEHPPGVLRELFDILYDEDIISDDAFIQWEKSEDPQEQEGKGMAMKQVVEFFTWLKEAEDDTES
ncbi:hypothetical protein CHS0354_013234 [Potamilus streckersoni]|uniref:Uncharacterized protein n=1 Tax=Potamilus streckersoni TaxID=2493646 RepID=A0AAE0T1M5_9BIVA|nr:hypothetical protein CHS0354_013234 [Potamilus streckersoni]